MTHFQREQQTILVDSIRFWWPYRNESADDLHEIRKVIKLRVWELRLLRTEAYTAALLKGGTNAVDRSLPR
jgi:hypothetical protein